MSFVTRDILVWRERDSLLNLKSRIELLFGVGINFPSHPTRIVARGDGAISENEWIKVSGPEEACYKTQQYVLATYRPDYSTVVPCGIQFANLLFNGSSKLRDAIEKDYQTILLPAPNGGVLVQGSNHSVQLTVTKLRNLMETLQSSGNNLTTTKSVTSPSSLELNEQLRQLIKEPGNVDNISDSLKQALLESLRKEPISTTATTGRDSSCSSPTQHEKRVKQIVSLGYPQDKVETVIGSLGIEASDNDIVARLVSIHSTKSRPLVPVVPPPPPPVTMTTVQREGLRPIVIDGSNIAMSHGNGATFSCRGIRIAVNWFLQRGHNDVTVFVPSWRKEPSKPETPIADQDILFDLTKANLVHYTPSRRVREKKIVCYDDRFIVKLAAERDGVIVSNDHFRDLLVENNSQWTSAIENRLLMYTFVGDSFMIPSDPLGKHGPHLNEFLSFKGGKGPAHEGTSEHPVPRDKQPCPYKERCNFGPRCRYYHPERDNKMEDLSTAVSPIHETKKDEHSFPHSNSPTKLQPYSLPQTPVDNPIRVDRPGGLNCYSSLEHHRTETFSPTYGRDTQWRVRNEIHPPPSGVISRGIHDIAPYTPTSEPLRNTQYMQRFARPQEYHQVVTPTSYYPDCYMDSSHRIHHSVETAPLPQCVVPPLPHSSRPYTTHVSTPYSYYKPPRDHTHSIFEHAVKLYPKERERIHMVLLQYPHIGDMTTLVKYLNMNR